jgi:hypothetical protein
MSYKMTTFENVLVTNTSFNISAQTLTFDPIRVVGPRSLIQ